MIERLYERPISEYITRLCRASEDVGAERHTVTEACALYKVSKVDLLKLVLEKAEWKRYVGGYVEEL